MTVDKRARLKRSRDSDFLHRRERESERERENEKREIGKKKGKTPRVLVLFLPFIHKVDFA